MATKKRTLADTRKTAAPAKTAPDKTVAKKSKLLSKPARIKNSDELVADSVAALSEIVGVLGITLEMLVQKIESMACHIIATEETLAELVASNGINLARVNARIRAKIAAGTENQGNSNQAIDVAAAIASPLPRR